ncbi:flagellin N-terminal-like domain-containing protein [Halogranum rubrum]|uniref:Flagellin N-terminal-like domain-containing protein n=1 Tax=Halogranum rubrum TaxID=553466 RepID=A0A1I4G790_9EURY|nr:type IV pilin [Halogranum rubrum]SFL25709.1 flagellin N-terminal-like domain-containing protein [Halogranum rubrum]
MSTRSRGVAPAIGVVLLVAVTVVLAATVGSVAFASVPEATEVSATTTPVALSVSVSGDRLTFTHRAGPTLAVDELTVHISVGGTALDHQPPVPFFSATGFRPGPTGPFNVASDGQWSVGETASVRIAATNDPSLVAGARVTVRVSSDERVLAQFSTTA